MIKGIVISFILMLSVISFSTYAQNCRLGESCPLPGNDHLDTQYIIQPINGTHFQCTIVASTPKLVFWLEGGQNFKVTRGEGLYTAAPYAVIILNGAFTKPNEPYSLGAIVIHRLQGRGAVNCIQ